MRWSLPVRGAAVVAVSLMVGSVAGTAAAKLGGASDGHVEFSASGPMGMKIIGKTEKIAVNEDAANVNVVVPLDTVSTGIDLRDRHMKEKYLEVGKFPNAQLTVPRAALKFPAGGAVTADVDGTMSIHGVTRPVKVHYTATPSAKGIDVNGTTHVNMGEYGIQVPSYAGVTVKPDVDLKVSFTAKDG